LDHKEIGHGTAFGLGPVEVYCEQSNIPSDSNNCGEFIDKLNNY